MSTMRVSFAILAISLVASGILSADDNLKPLWGWDRYPGYLFYYMERPTPHRIEMRLVADGATQGYSLDLSFPEKPGPPGFIFRELHRKDARDYTDYEGFSVWVRGDGSEAKGRVVFGYTDGPTATFPLKDKTWHRVDLRWRDFDRPVNVKGLAQLAFSLSADSKRPARYTIDRPGFVKSLADLDDADRKAGYGTGVYPSLVTERPKDLTEYVARGDRLKRTLRKLRGKEPLTILAWGDSITNGAQLWPVGDADAQDRATYHTILVEKLKKKYGYDDITRLHEATGGYQTHQALPNIRKEVFEKHPHVVILAVGAGDTLYSNFDRFKENWTQIVEALQAEGIEVILWTPTPIEFKVAQGEPFADYVRKYAKEHDLPLVDERAAFLARGEVALAELIPDDAHPNPRGHELLAEVLFALFE